MGESIYWRLHPAPLPGDTIAEHNGYDRGASGTGGPGNYRVEVHRPGREIEGSPLPPRWHRTIWLMDQDSKVVARFNRGMARWFGLRLIEAAELDELRGGDTAGIQIQAELQKLSDWVQENAIDWVKPGRTVVDSAIDLLAEAKQFLADHQDLSFPEPATQQTQAQYDRLAGKSEPGGMIEIRQQALSALRETATQVITQRSKTAVAEWESARANAIDIGVMTPEAVGTEVIGYLSPHQQQVFQEQLRTFGSRRVAGANEGHTTS